MNTLACGLPFRRLITRLKLALEEYIKQVKETWTSYTLDLVNYQNKCRLIRYTSNFVFCTLKLTDTIGVGMSCSTNAAKTSIHLRP